MFAKAAFGLLVLSLATGCATTPIGTRAEAFPSMYTDKKPTSMLVVPAVNNSTAADAADLLNVTVAQPFVDHGYYVFPMPVITEIFQREGVIDGTQARSLPMGLFRKNFGADSVLFLTIDEWDKTYAVIAANITVGIQYVLVSTDSSEVLWSYRQKVVIDTSGSSGFLLADLVVTAINTAIADYVPVAAQVHARAVQGLPFGKYHPQTGADGALKTVDLSARDSALEVAQ
jgi:hypothetical protein